VHSPTGCVTDTEIDRILARLSQRIRFTASRQIAAEEVRRLVDVAMDGAAPELAAVHMRSHWVLADFLHVETPHQQQRSGRSTTRHGPRVSNGISARWPRPSDGTSLLSLMFPSNTAGRSSVACSFSLLLR
jgi:hypothetical protein